MLVMAMWANIKLLKKQCLELISLVYKFISNNNVVEFNKTIKHSIFI